jgi:hypothetical protein
MPYTKHRFDGGNTDARRAFLIFVIPSERAGVTNGAKKISLLHYI